jgi:hypothetical protein
VLTIAGRLEKQHLLLKNSSMDSEFASYQSFFSVKEKEERWLN